MNERGPYRSREETQRRLLAAGVDLARHRLPTDPFGHVRTNDLIDEAGVSTSALYRAFGTVENFHRVLAAASFADLMADEFDNLQVAMAALHEDESDGPDGVPGINGPWSPTGVGSWALGEHMLEMT